MSQLSVLLCEVPPQKNSITQSIAQSLQRYIYPISFTLSHQPTNLCPFSIIGLPITVFEKKKLLRRKLPYCIVDPEVRMYTTGAPLKVFFLEQREVVQNASTFLFFFSSSPDYGWSLHKECSIIFFFFTLFHTTCTVNRKPFDQKLGYLFLFFFFV